MGRLQADAASSTRYDGTARMAYLMLPSSIDRHRRVLLAHRAARRAAGVADPAQARAVVLRAVLGAAPRRWEAWSWRGADLRLFPPLDEPKALRLDQRLGGLSVAQRAAFVLLELERLDEYATVDTLRAAGVGEPVAATAAAAAVAAELAQTGAGAGPAGPLLLGPAFDPCYVRARPGLVRSGARRPVVVLAALCVVVGVALAATAAGLRTGADAGPVLHASCVEATGTPPSAAGPGAWTDTARLDFGVWPARGPSLDDASLVARALDSWCTPTLVRAEPGTDALPPLSTPRVLWAGHLDGAAVVLLDDGTRLARYTRPDTPTAADPERLQVARHDDADVTTAGAVLLRSTAAGDRFLIAPWVGSLQLRDLRTPDTPARDLAEHDGVTPLVARPPAGGCGSSWPVLQLRSSSRVAEHHAFLLTDLGRVVATHLTYQPPPQAGPAQSPREATGPAALVLWSRLACTLPALRGADVKAVNAWEFAQQPLPGNAGTAAWVCARADHWDGAGSAGTFFLAPGAGGATVTGSEPDGRACSRFEQNVVAQVRWTPSGGGPALLLAAGSRRVHRITPPGGPGTDVTADHVLSAPWARGGPVTAVLDDGTVIRPLPARG
ncbi:hypothetical protein [Streptacidiphilus jiangxiensis]|uniref:DNA-directed RNA polymerase specialized sigma subunit, sigma24 family n=1 Tax=Streptacidiphilus jiangxiensis TaxID=235985 RepID=A0A1H7N3W2_STRJI|nr:hypothetical protein [Streptacidiphilus jiangxiensis]SEL18163.1 hypothetical protein SAMN05414137_106198 [Streptacidiphilus jiangxiensis]